MEVADVKSII